VVNTWLRPESGAHLESLFGRNDTTKAAADQAPPSLPQASSQSSSPLFKIEANDEEGQEAQVLPAVQSSPTISEGGTAQTADGTAQEAVAALTTVVKTEPRSEISGESVAGDSSMMEVKGERNLSKRASRTDPPHANFFFVKTKGARGRVVANILKKCAEPDVRWQNDMEGFGDDWNDDDNNDDDDDDRQTPGGNHEGGSYGGRRETKEGGSGGGGDHGGGRSSFLDGDDNCAAPDHGQQDQGRRFDRKHTNKASPLKWKKKKKNKYSRQFYHSSDMTPCQEQDLSHDSDDDQNVDNQWLIDQNRQSIEELEDATTGEKTYMIKWNHFVSSHEIYADIVFPSMCEMFARLNGKWLLENKLRTNFLLHLLTMWEFKLISTRTIQKCMILVDTSGGDITRHSLTLNRAVAEKDRNVVAPVSTPAKRKKQHRSNSAMSKMLVEQH